MTNPEITVVVKGTPETFTSAFATTRDAADFLRDQDKRSEFADSLLQKLGLYGAATSPRQQAWIHRLATDAKNPRKPESLDINLSGLVATMDAASANASRTPKIRLRAPDGTPITMSRATSRSSREGTINVTDGQPYGENRWFGRIETDGTVSAGRAMIPAVHLVLTDIAADAVAAFKKFSTGSCCFCAKELTDDASRAFGYGPTCAKKNGLPWGAKAAEAIR